MNLEGLGFRVLKVEGEMEGGEEVNVGVGEGNGEW